MPTYRVRSGDMNERVIVPHHAQPPAIFFMALRQMMDHPAKSLGQIVEIAGGNYKGDDVVYASSERLMADAGLLDPNDRVQGEPASAGVALEPLVGQG